MVGNVVKNILGQNEEEYERKLAQLQQNKKMRRFESKKSKEDDDYMYTDDYGIPRY